MTEKKSTILVATNFDEASSAALAFAKDLAAKLGADLLVMHAYKLPAYIYAALEAEFMPTLSEELARAARLELDKLAADAGGLRTMLREGDPADQILAAIAEVSPQIVVMGTHGRRGLEHMILGSVAEKVIRRSPVPVVTTHAA